MIDPVGNLELRSDDSWNLVCSIETVGPDLLCRIHGGDKHIGAVALAEWKDRRPTDRTNGIGTSPILQFGLALVDERTASPGIGLNWLPFQRSLGRGRGGLAGIWELKGCATKKPGRYGEWEMRRSTK